MKNNMQIIDFRCRPPFGNLARDWIFSLEDKPGNPGLATKYAHMNMELPNSLVLKSMDVFLGECKTAHISQSVVPLRKLPTQSNDDLVKLIEAFPQKFMGFAGLQPVEEGIAFTLSQIKQYAVDGPCVGVYMEPGLDPKPWYVDDKNIFPIYEFCETHDLPVCLLYGGIFHKKNPPCYAIYDPARIEIIAQSFPRLRILLSHACWPFTTLACALALNYENIWLSPDGFMIDHPGSNDYVVAANYRLQNKIIFGSLYPSMPVEFAVTKYKNLLRPEVWNEVFYENAVNFIKLKTKSRNIVKVAYN